MIKKNSKIFVAGHTGLVGSAIVRKLKEKGYKNILTISRLGLDLTNQTDVYKFLKKKNQNLSLSPLQKLVEYILMINTRLILFMKIYQYKIT